MLVDYLLLSSFSLLYSLIVGIGLLKLLKKRFVYCPIILVTFLAALSFIFCLFQVQIWFLYLIPLIILFLPFYRKIRKLERDEKKLLLFFIIQFYFYIILQILVPFYPLGRDWYMHYQSSLEISNNNIKFFGERNPIFNLIEGSFLTIIGKHFFVAQITTCLIGSFIVFPYYLISKRFLKQKFMTISFIFLIFSPFIIENTLYNWSKILDATFVLYFIYFVIEKKYVLSYVSGILAFLTHSQDLFFTLPIYFKKSFKKRSWLKYFVLFIGTIFIIIFLKNIVGFSKNYWIYYPLAVDGYTNVLNKTTDQIIQGFLSKPFYYPIYVRIINLANTIFPTIPILKLINEFKSLPIIRLHKIVDINKLPLIYYYYHSVPGALTSGVYIFFIISVLKRRNTDFVLSYIMLPLIVVGLFFGWVMPGLARSSQALIPLILILSVQEMSKYNKKIIGLLFLILIIETVFFFMLYNNFIGFSVKHLIEAGDYKILQLNTIHKLIFKRDLITEYNLFI